MIKLTISLSQAEFWPDRIDFCDDVIAHFDEFGVVAGEAVFARPFVGAIEADFAAETFGDGGVVELIDGATGVEGITTGVAVGTDAEEHFADILHVGIFIENEYELGKTEAA